MCTLVLSSVSFLWNILNLLANQEKVSVKPSLSTFYDNVKVISWYLNCASKILYFFLNHFEILAIRIVPSNPLFSFKFSGRRGCFVIYDLCLQTIIYQLCLKWNPQYELYLRILIYEFCWGVGAWHMNSAVITSFTYNASKSSFMNYALKYSRWIVS